MTFRRFPDGWPCDQLAPEDVTLEQVRVEVMRARKKFPGSRFLFTALVEEMGELAGEIVRPKTPEDWRKECIQVACVAIRLAEEGDVAYDAEWKSRVPWMAYFVGELCRSLLQRNDITPVAEAIGKGGYEIAEYGEPMYAAVTDEESQK